MEPEEKFEILKNKIINKFSKISDCIVEFSRTSTFYNLECKHPNAYSSISFDNYEIIRGAVEIELKDLYYFVEIDIPIEELAEEYLFRAHLCKKFRCYLKLLKSVIKHYGLREYVRQTLLSSKTEEVEIKITSGGFVELIYRYTKDHNEIRGNIEISKDAEYLLLKALRTFTEVDVAFIDMRPVPEALKSVIKYALNISRLEELLRLEDAIKKLSELIEVRKYTVENAIRELVEVYGYRDIFGS